MANIQNNTEPWHDHTGKEVEEYIKNRFTTIEEDSKNYINDIQVVQSEGYTTYTLKNGKSEDIAIIVPTTLTSGFKVILSKFESDKEFAASSESIKFNYAFWVRDAEDSVLSNKSCEIRVTVRSGSHSRLINKGKTDPSRSNVARTGSFELKGSDLFEGANTIELNLVYVHEGAESKMETEGVVESFLTVNSFNLKLQVQESNEFSVSKQISTRTKGSFTISNTMASGKNLPEGLDVKTYIYGYNQNGNFISNEYTGNVIDLTNYSGVNNSELKIFIQSQITIGSSVVKSNVVFYQYVLENRSMTPCFAFKLDNYTTQDDEGNITNAGNYTESVQYNTFNWNVYTYGSGVYSLSLNEKKITELEFDEDGMHEILFSQVLSKAGNNVFSISNKNRTLPLTVATTGLMTDLVVPSDVYISLNADGKQGADSDWGDITSFNQFDWSVSGWDGSNLVVTNGAFANIYAKAFNKVDEGKTISIRFKTKNSSVEETLISCVDGKKNGFKITSQTATLYKNGGEVSTTFNTEEEYQEVTFVWHPESNLSGLGEIYVNGTRQNFIQNTGNSSHSEPIVISATNIIGYISHINIYNRDLTFSEIQAIYCTNKNSDIGDYVVKNNIFNNDVIVGDNTKKVTIDTLPVGSTYLLIKSHPNDTSPQGFWWYINSVNGGQQGAGEKYKGYKLPVGNSYLITKTADGSGHEDNFFVNEMTISAQGTSSMAYPIKNYRIYLDKKYKTSESFEGFQVDSSDTLGKTSKMITGVKVFDTNQTFDSDTSETKGFKLTRDSLPVQRLCLKADYAESSGTHNTGFAKLANYALESSNAINSQVECPGLPINSYNPRIPVRSTIDGKTIYLFFQKNNDEPIYAGRYNMNNDKANEAVYGFTDNGLGDQPYFDEEIVQNEYENLKSKFGITDNSFEQTHFTFKDSNGNEHVNPTECWEFSTNEPSGLNVKDELKNNTILKRIGAFTFPYSMEPGYPYYTSTTYTGLDPFTVSVASSDQSIDGKLAWLNTEQAWEYRYPELEDELHNLYADGTVQPYLLKTLYKWLHKHNVYLWPEESKEEHAAIFAQDLHRYFNINYLLKYYMLTKMFVNADQRIKNCMLAFYCDPKVENGPIGHMRAYYLFYDNDTILGLNNNGQLDYNWNVDEAGVYPGVDQQGVGYHAIWGNLDYCYQKYINNGTSNTQIINLGKLIENAYSSLRSKLGDETIFSYFDTGMPDSTDNVDVEVKYYYPCNLTAMEGVSNFDSNQLARFTGTRKYHRQWFITNRLRWFDAKYGSDSKYIIGFKGNDTPWSNDTIKIVSCLDNWRFKAENRGSELSRTNLLNNGELGTLSLQGYYTISDPSSISGLYGAKEIDFSGVYGEAINGKYPGFATFELSKELPNLQILKLGNLNHDFCCTLTGINNSLNKKDDRGNFVQSNVPNLRQLHIINVKDYSEASGQSPLVQLDLSRLYKLEMLDLTQTNIPQVLLPKTTTLTNVSLFKPTKLTFENNLGLTTLNIHDSELLEVISAKHCSSELYKQLLLLYKNSNKSASFTLEFGSGVKKDTITLDVISELVELANLKKELNLTKVSVSGNAYCPQFTDAAQTALLGDVFPDLVILKDISTDAGLSSSGNLLEGKVIDIISTLPVDKDDSGEYLWSISCTGDGTLSSKIKIINKSLYKCTLEADIINDNISRDAQVIVSASCGGQIITTTVQAQCKAISTIYLTTNENIINEGSTGSINIKFNTTHTKNHWIRNNVSISLTSGRYELSQPDQITYVNVEGIDSTITVSLGEISGSIIMYNNTIIDKSTVSTGTQYTWLAQLLEGSDLAQYSRQQFRNIQLDVSGGNIYRRNANSTISVSTDITTSQDLSYLEYFSLANNTVTIPSVFPFSNLRIPDTCTNVVWTNLHEKQEGTTIIMPTNLTQASINLSTISIGSLAGLQFDLSKCAGIKRIVNYTNNTSNIGDFNITITDDSGNLSGNAYSIEKPLFIYRPNTINQLGYFPSNLNLESSPFPSSNFIFNNTSSKKPSAESAKPMFYLGNVNNMNGIKVGIISSYTCNDQIFDVSAMSPYITDLYYTFQYGSGIGSSLSYLTFPNLKVVGDLAFNELNANQITQITLNPNVTYIGYGAFMEYKGNLATTEFTNIQVASKAFQNMNSTTFGFNESVTLSNHVFTNYTNKYTIEFKPNGKSINVTSQTFYDGITSSAIHDVTLISDNITQQDAFKQLAQTVNSMTIKSKDGDIIYQK